MKSKRGVIVVHGLGEQPKGDTLNYIGRPIVEFLEGALPDSVPIRMEARFDPPSGPATAALRFQDGAREEEWIIREAWWAKAFVPTPSDELLIWALGLLVNRLGRIAYGVGSSPWRRAVDPPWVEKSFGREFLIRPRRGFWSGAWDVVVAGTWLTLLVVLFVPALLAGGLLYLLGQLPVLEWALKPIQEGFANFLVKGLGDQHATTLNRLARDSVSTTVLDSLADWLKPTANFESITVVAHSGGCVVALDAMTSPEMHDSLAALGTHLPDITLCTLGSGLNAAYTYDPGSAAWDARFPKGVRWVDFWGRYDPIPAGPPERDMVERSGCEESIDFRVSNRDNPLDDHGTYFENRSEVLSRIVRAILRGPAGPPATLLAAAQSYHRGIRDHRQSVAIRAGLRILTALGGTAAAYYSGVHLGIGALIVLMLPSPQDAGWPLKPLVDWGYTLTGLTAIGLAGTLLGLYVLWQVVALGAEAPAKARRMRSVRRSTRKRV